MAYTGPVYPFDHNWIDPVVERLAWLTNVLRKRSGAEQRIRLRQKPRRTFEYTALIGGQDELDQSRRFDRLLWTTQDQAIMVPFWPDAVELTAQLTAGANHVAGLPKLDGYDFAQAQHVILWRNYRTYEIIEIASLVRGAPGQINFATNVVATWPAGTQLVPALLCRFTPSMTGDIHATDIKSVKVSFERIVSSAIPAEIGYPGWRGVSPTLDTYRDVPVYNEPGLDGGNTHDLERLMQRVDFNSGLFHYDSIQSAPFGTIESHFSLSERTEISHMFGWLFDRVGRQKSFWLPTWEKDFESITITDDAEFTATSFGYTSGYASTEGRRDIAFIYADGSMVYRRITSSSDDGTLETFTLDDDVPTLTNLDRVSFLRFCRLDQDEIELAYFTTDDVAVAVKLRELIKTA